MKNKYNLYENSEGDFVLEFINEKKERSTVVIKEIKFLDEESEDGSNVEIEYKQLTGPEVDFKLIEEAVQNMLSSAIEHHIKENNEK